VRISALLLGLTLSVSALARVKVPNPHETLISTHTIFKNSVSDNSGDIFLLTQPGSYLLEESEFKDDFLHSSHISTKHDGKVDLVLPKHPMSTHGYAWDYDLRIPLTFFDPSQNWFRKGTYTKVAVQQDIAPTLADVLGIPAPDRAEGRVLREARQKQSPKRPKVILVFVQDQMGLQYYKAHPHRARYLRKIMSEGATFTNAQVAHVDVETAVGHVAVGTGAYARGHHVSSNTVWRPGLWAASGVYSAKLTETLSSEAFPLMLDAATLADVWLKARDNKPQVFSVVAASRAAISMGGHGSMFSGNKKTAVVYLATKGPAAGQFVTNDAFYELPEPMNGKSIKPYVDSFLKERDGKWFDHDLYLKNGDLNIMEAMGSPASVRFESDLILASLPVLKIGDDDETDLIFINFKASDYCGHSFGYESEECGQVLEEVDLAIQKIMDKASELSGNSYLTVLTADHGAAPIPELSGAIRFSRDRLKADINKQFSSKTSSSDVAPFITSSQIWLNRTALKASGHTVEELVSFLKKYEVPMEAPWNLLAKEWRAKGKPAKSKLFYEVVSREDVMKN
jgi:predicted AlkP superfamily pyrophosphatase or phosphodiesterase